MQSETIVLNGNGRNLPAFKTRKAIAPYLIHTACELQAKSKEKLVGTAGEPTDHAGKSCRQGSVIM
jgi:hypothetical protein